MSKIIPLNVQTPFQGSYAPLPVGLCTPAKVEPRSVPVRVVWGTYGASLANNAIGVKVNLQNQQSGPILDKIRSIKIDNSFCAVPVYVQFPDTLDTVICPPNAVIIWPVLTNALEAIIYTEGLWNGRPPSTTVEFTNIDRQGAIVESGAIDGVDIRFLDNATLSGVPLSVNTFPAFAIEAPPAVDRLIVVGAVALGNAAGARTLTGITVNGVALTIITSGSSIATANNPGGFTNVLSLGYAIVPLGTTLAIVSTYNANMRSAGVWAYSIDNWTQLIPADSDSVYGVTPTSFRTNKVNAIPGGGAISMLSIADPIVNNDWSGAQLDQADQYDTAAQPDQGQSASVEFTENNGKTISTIGNSLVTAMWI